MGSRLQNKPFIKKKIAWFSTTSFFGIFTSQRNKEHLTGSWGIIKLELLKDSQLQMWQNWWIFGVLFATLNSMLLAFCVSPTEGIFFHERSWGIFYQKSCNNSRERLGFHHHILVAVPWNSCEDLGFADFCSNIGSPIKSHQEGESYQKTWSEVRDEGSVDHNYDNHGFILDLPKNEYEIYVWIYVHPG